VSGGHWFLPETPDMLGLLRGQLRVTIEGVDAFARWAAGDPAAADDVRETEQRGDAAKRELLIALRAAFVTPLEPEDLFTLSRGIDWVLNYVRDLVTESEIMSCPPDAGLAEMAALLGEALGHIDDALGAIESDEAAATTAADAAVTTERRLEGVYYRGMAGLLDVEDRQERIALRELYRRCARIGEVVIDVSERIVYAVVKES
jgi:uncharacterized protein Yka (UPF0111/DUF47 family)